MMESNFLTIEAFAHYMRGVVTLFFLFWCIRLYRSSRRSRMIRWLFVSTLYILLSHLKDVVFLVNEWKNSIFIDNLVNAADLLFIPLISAFFLEACRPGFATRSRVAAALGLQAVFVPAYWLFPDERVLDAAYALALGMTVATVVTVMVFTVHYRRRLAENYSYRENIDVLWVAVSCVVYFSSLLIYICAFDDTTWLSEALYNLFSIVLWSVLFALANRHRVMRGLFPLPADRRRTAFSRPAPGTGTVCPSGGDVPPAGSSETSLPPQPEAGSAEPQLAVTAAPAAAAALPETADEAGTEADLLSQQQREKMLAERLTRCLEQEKPFLNPKLSLGEMALAVGTNKTYLSNYINKALGTTFYELVNAYRVEAACGLIQGMSETGRIPMTEVAERSGFNSLTSFNRYFLKVKGVTPKQYYFAMYDRPAAAPAEKEE